MQTYPTYPIAVKKLTLALEQKNISILKVYTLGGKPWILHLRHDQAFEFMAVLPEGTEFVNEAGTKLPRAELERVRSHMGINEDTDAAPGGDGSPGHSPQADSMSSLKNVEQFMITRYMQNTIIPDRVEALAVQDLMRQARRVSLALGNIGEYRIWLAEGELVAYGEHTYRLVRPAAPNPLRLMHLTLPLEDVIARRFDGGTTQRVHMELVQIILGNTSRGLEMLRKVHGQVGKAVQAMQQTSGAVQELMSHSDTNAGVHRRMLHTVLCSEKISFENAALLHNVSRNINVLEDVLANLDAF